MEATTPRAVEKRFWAFLSYSRLDKDDGARLHARLESYRVPRPLVGQASVDGAIPPRLTPIFRDLEDLPAAGSLSGSIAQALDASRYLVLLCTPASAGSPHVNQEVATFIRAVGRERIRCFVPASVPPEFQTEDLIPAALRVAAEGDVPLATDERPAGDGKDAFLKLVAGLLGIGLDTLKRREQTRQRRRLTIAALAILFVGFTGFAVIRGFTDEARRARAEADAGTRKAALVASANAVERAMAHHSKGEAGPALAWLARAVRLDAQNPAATSAIVTLLLNRHWPSGHFGGGIASAKVSGDGRTLVALTTAGAGQVWELASGRRLPVDGLQAPIDTLAVSHDGSRIAMGRGPELAVITVASGEAHSVTRDDTARTCDLRFVGADLWAVSSSGRIERWRDGTWTRIDTVSGTVTCTTVWTVSPDGTMLAVAHDAEIRLVDVSVTPATVKPLPGTEGPRTLHFAPGGRVLAVATAGAIQLRDVRTGERVGASLRTIVARDPDVAFSVAGPMVAMHDRAGHAVVFPEWPDHEDAAEHPLLRTPTPVQSIAFDQTGLRVLTVGENDKVSVWTLGEPAPVRMELPPLDDVTAAWFTGDPLTLATLREGAMTLWALRARGAGMVHLRYDSTSFPARIRFSPDGDRVVGQSELQTNVWTRDGGELLGRLTEESVAVGANATHLAAWGPAEGGGYALDVHDLRNPDQVLQASVASAIRAAALDASSRQIAVAFEDGISVGTVAPGTSLVLRQIAKSAIDVFAVGWLREGKAVLVHAGDRLDVVRASDGATLAQLPCQTPLAWHEASGAVACGARGRLGWLRLGEALTVQRGDVAFDAADGISFSDAGAWLIANGKSQARLVEMATGRVAAPPSGHRHVLAVHEGSRVAASRSGRHDISLWNLESGVVLGTAMAHTVEVTCGTFSPAGDMLATGAGEQVQLWDTAVRIGQPLGSPHAMPTQVHGVAFSPNGQTLAASVADGFGTQAYPGYVVLINIMRSVSTDAETLARLAEAVAGVRLNEADAVVPHPQADAARAALARSKDPFLAWYFHDPWTRTLTPSSSVTVGDYLERKLTAGYYEQAEGEFPGHPIFAKYPRSTMVRPFTPLREMAQHEEIFQLLKTTEELDDAELANVRVTTAQLSKTGAMSIVAINRARDYCGASSCSFPLAVLDADGTGWRVAGEGVCKTPDPRLVLTTRGRPERVDFFCGPSEFRWNGRGYAKID